jgi:hypothetical protein
MKARPLLALVLAGGAQAMVMHGPALAQVARPPSGGVLNRFLAPPSGVQQSFLGTWNLTWEDPGDPKCPCRGTLTVDTQADGSLKGYWSIRKPAVILLGEVAFDNNVWVGDFAQPDDNVDFPLKGHFRLETRGGGTALTGSYQRDGTAIPRSWSATRQ